MHYRWSFDLSSCLAARTSSKHFCKFFCITFFSPAANPWVFLISLMSRSKLLFSLRTMVREAWFCCLYIYLRVVPVLCLGVWCACCRYSCSGQRWWCECVCLCGCHATCTQGGWSWPPSGNSHWRWPYGCECLSSARYLHKKQSGAWVVKRFLYKLPGQNHA